VDNHTVKRTSSRAFVGVKVRVYEFKKRFPITSAAKRTRQYNPLPGAFLLRLPVTQQGAAL
jgi:hypothetical protein